MSQPNTHKIAMLDQAGRSILVEPKKSAVLALLLATLAFLVIRQMVVAPAGMPAPAAAAGVSRGGSAGAAVGTSAEKGGLAARSGNATSPVLAWLDSPPAPLTRNLFAVRTELFPTENPASAATEPNRRGFWDEVAKSLLDHADQQERKQRLLNDLQAQASALQVTSVLMGPQPRAVINGELVGEGDVVAAFRVLKIEARRIVIEREGIRLEITMK